MTDLEQVTIDGIEFAKLSAGALNAGQIGAAVRFHWAFPSSEVKADVLGELRQVYHTGSDTVLNLTAPDSDTADLSEFVLTHATTVLVPTWAVPRD